MASITLTQQQFLELLRSGLWGTPADPALFQGNVDWKAILRIALEQTVQVIIADGIETLPEECWPPKEALRKLMMVRIRTKQTHMLLNNILNLIVNALDAEGIPSILLKGQGVAQDYRIPESRMCGDIDLYVGPENYERACEIIAGLNPDGKDGEECEHHMHLQVGGVEVEVHRIAGTMPSTKLQTEFLEWTKKCTDINSARLRTWDNDGTQIHLADPTFDALFILYHITRHMTAEGIGFRQVCDWTMFLHKHHASINSKELRQKLNDFYLKTVWKGFGTLAVTVLGLPKEELPLAPDKLNSTSKIEGLISQIFISGNFGRYDIKARDYSPTTYLKRKWRTFSYLSMRFIKLYRIFPYYSTHHAVIWFVGGIKRLLRGE